jgi:hypothetical protein
MQHFNQVDFLWRALAIFLLIGALAGIALSMLLIFKPHVIERVNRVANHWVSMRRISQVMDRSIRMERWFYRHHRVLGFLVIVGAGYMLFYFGWLLDKAAALHALGIYLNNPSWAAALLPALLLVARLSGALALLVGIIYWIRPSLLKGFETGSNQWLSFRRATKVLDIQRGEIDQLVERHAQRVGWLLLLGSIALFVVMLHRLVQLP